MPYAITPAQREHVTSLSAPERYFHFIDNVVKHEALWTLKKGDELLLFSDEEQRMIIPVWPHPDYAQIFAVDDWKDAPAVRIDLDSFLNRTLPSCIEDDVHFLVFPTSATEGAVSSAEDVKNELLAARDNAQADSDSKSVDALTELPDDFIDQL